MKESINNCKCLEKLILIGKVESFTHEDTLSYYSNEVEKGTLCLSTNVIEDKGHHTFSGWQSELVVEKELYPIEYCPMCGKKIEYRKVKTLKIEK